MSRRFTIRFSENSALHIQNVARLYHVSISTVIKAMTMNSINAILDKDGDKIRLVAVRGGNKLFCTNCATQAEEQLKKESEAKK